MRWWWLVVVAGCGVARPVPPTAPAPALPKPQVLCEDMRLPPMGAPYCVGQNRGAAPARFPPLLPIDWDGTCPQCGFSLHGLPDGGVEYRLRGSVSPYAGKKEVDFDLVRALPDRADGLRGFVTRYERIELAGLRGNVTVAPALWFKSRSDTRTCANPHSWLAVMLPGSRPIASRVSRDVLYRSRNSWTCGQMYVFDATGPTVGWTPGTPLTIDWSHLLDVIHSRGWWPAIHAEDAYAVTQFAAEIAGFTPGGQPAAASGTRTGSATVRMWGWQ